MVLKRKFGAEAALLGHESPPRRHALKATSLSDFDLRSDVLKPNSQTSCSRYSGYTTASSTCWSDERERPWRTLGTKDVAYSLPLENMVTAVQDLIDPDFDPSVLTKNDDEPNYLKPLPSRIAQDDIDFLREKGALTIPNEKLRNELLRSYVQWSYSFMPTIDLHEFLRCIVENDPNGNISLLVFQAVMFAGTAFIDLKFLQEAGYETRQSARVDFFSRVRHLYAFDYEDDRLAVLQTLLLMTYWSDYESSPQKDIWHWIGVCNTQAQSIGLHKDPTHSNIDPQLQRLRIRLWWSLYSRDRLIAIALRRPTQINEGICDVPMVTLDDCDIGQFHPSIIEVLQCPLFENTSQQKQLATMFIEHVKLCQCLGRILFAQYSPSHYEFGTTDKTTITLVPRQASETEIDRCIQQLDRWLHGLSRDAQFIPVSRYHIRKGENVLLLHSAMLRMMYHAVSSTLHRPQTLILPDNKQSKNENEVNISRTKLEDAATSITHIMQGLDQLNLVKFLPQSGVTVLLPAALVHLANLTSTDPILRESSAYKFHRCIQVLDGLKEIYPAANMEDSRIKAAVKVQCIKLKAYISITCNNDIDHNGLDRQTASTIFSELLECCGCLARDDNFTGDTIPNLCVRTNSDSDSSINGITPRCAQTELRDPSPKYDIAIHPTTTFPENIATLSPLDNNAVEPFQPYLPDFVTSPTDIPLDMIWTENVLKGWTRVNEDTHEEKNSAHIVETVYESAITNTTAYGTTDGELSELSEQKIITGDLDWDLGFV